MGMIDKIAMDLGICRFAEESLTQFKSRVIYSAMACWMKAIALDRPVGYQGKTLSGVSRRHIYDRSHTILETIIKMFPELNDWFDLSMDSDDPVNLIRTRLINHGDLLNAGFDTNLALSSVHSKQITSNIETVYGKMIDDGLQYSGVATIRNKEASDYITKIENVCEWMQSYLKDASWSHDLPGQSQLQFYNPLSTSKNNYAAWQESAKSATDKIALVRTALNKNSYSYYIFRPKEKLIHRIDPFLQEQGFHIRVMCALRSQLKNNTASIVTNFSDHIKIQLNALLPLQESIILESYAWPVRRINDKLEWIMSIPVWGHIKPYIEALDIQITEEEHG